MGPLQVEAIGLRVAVDVVEVAVRLSVVLPQVPQDRGVVRISVGAHEVGAAIGQRCPGLGEAEVVVGPRLIQVGAEAERRAIRIRERRQADPDPAGRIDGPPQPVDQPAADRSPGLPRDPLGELVEPDGPRGPRAPGIDQGLEGVARLVPAHRVDVDRDVLGAEHRRERGRGVVRPSNRMNRPPRKMSGCGSRTTSNGTPSWARTSSSPGGVLQRSSGSEAGIACIVRSCGPPPPGPPRARTTASRGSPGTGSGPPRRARADASLAPRGTIAGADAACPSGRNHSLADRAASRIHPESLALVEPLDHHGGRIPGAVGRSSPAHSCPPARTGRPWPEHAHHPRGRRHRSQRRARGARRPRRRSRRREARQRRRGSGRAEPSTRDRLSRPRGR